MPEEPSAIAGQGSLRASNEARRETLRLLDNLHPPRVGVLSGTGPRLLIGGGNRFDPATLDNPQYSFLQIIDTAPLQQTRIESFELEDTFTIDVEFDIEARVCNPLGFQDSFGNDGFIISPLLKVLEQKIRKKIAGRPIEYIEWMKSELARVSEEIQTDAPLFRRVVQVLRCEMRVKGGEKYQAYLAYLSKLGNLLHNTLEADGLPPMASGDPAEDASASPVRLFDFRTISQRAKVRGQEALGERRVFPEISDAIKQSFEEYRNRELEGYVDLYSELGLVISRLKTVSVTEKERWKERIRIDIDALTIP